MALLYRRSGNLDHDSWSEAILVNDNESRLLEIVTLLDFSTEGVEDDLGYAKLHWDVTDVIDSTYDVKVQSMCALEHSHTELNYYNSKTIEFVFDTNPPAIYGKPKIELIGPFDSVQQDEFIFPFTEVLYCIEPYVFNLTVTLSIHELNDEDSHAFFQGSGIRILCEGREIKYRFDVDVLNDYISQYSSQTDEIHVNIQLEGVEDMARNRMDTFDRSFTWALVR